ncbi:MAG TPA: translation initiation factor IF-3 [Waddliaceae bacterium]
MRVNREIRAPKVRVISQTGEQVGVLSIRDALQKAEEEGVDLVEIVPGANPPVCKIIDYGKYRYDQTKREKESKKASQKVVVKEIKLKPNIDEHDLQTKLRQAREFFAKGNKVKVTCTFRGREMAHTEIGEKLIQRVCEELEDSATIESPMQMMGRVITLGLVPAVKKKK